MYVVQQIRQLISDNSFIKSISPDSGHYETILPLTSLFYQYELSYLFDLNLYSRILLVVALILMMHRRPSFDQIQEL
jgi:hypothetical protein